MARGQENVLGGRMRRGEGLMLGYRKNQPGLGRAGGAAGGTGGLCWVSRQSPTCFWGEKGLFWAHRNDITLDCGFLPCVGGKSGDLSPQAMAMQG